MTHRLRRRTTTSLVLATALAASTSPAAAQNDVWPLSRPPFLWSDWEMPGPPPDSATLGRLGICPRVAGRVAGLFHWVDVDGDGFRDLVFSGPVTWCTDDPEGYVTTVYLSRGDRLILTMHAGGSVAGMWRALPSTPVSMLLVQSYSEGLGETHYVYYAPHVVGDTVSFRPARALAVTRETRLPETYAAQPTLFSAARDSAVLRADPLADADENVLFAFPAGSRGVALAEWTDAEGQVWWFVRIRPPQDDPWVKDSGSWLPETEILGWMRADALVPQQSPEGRVDTLAPFISGR